jgi:hypothetical protein
MPYWFLNKQTRKARVFGSRSPIVECTDLTENELNHAFSRKKQSEYENEKYRIVRVDLERGGKH